MGRTTGATEGDVNDIMLQHWDNGAATYEIAIVGKVGLTFANRGDSGGCVFVVEGETYKAAGLLIGKVEQANIAFATPLRMILKTAGDYEWVWGGRRQGEGGRVRKPLELEKRGDYGDWEGAGERRDLSGKLASGSGKIESQ